MKATSVTQKVWRCAIAAVLAFGLAFSSAALQAVPALAANDAVQADANGVFKFNWVYRGSDYSRGSCFLINEDTVITAYHCIGFTEDELKQYGFDSETAEDIMADTKWTVNVMGDVTVSASYVNGSKDQDFAILKLDSKVNNKTALTFIDSTTMKATDEAYSLGFPANNDIEVIKNYTSDQITINSGKVIKAETLIGSSGYYVQTDVKISGGDSGGPMVNKDGYVFGISVSGSDSDDHYYAVASDVIMKALDSLGIEYSSTTATSSATASSAKTELDFSALKSAISKAEAVDSSKYTKETYAAVTAALTEAKAALETELDSKASASDVAKLQAEVDAAAKELNDAVSSLQEQSGPNVALIAVVVVVLIAVVVIIVVLVMRSKKKKEEEAASQPNAYTAQAPAPVQPAQPQYAAPQPLPYGDETEAATTVLDEGGADTVILFQAASGGSLTRMSNNEHIPINKAEFTIGRERSKVDYCLEGNGSISRIHVRLCVRDGNTYVVDNKAANGTFVNGVKLRAGEEVQLNAGDIVTLADEKFKYQN